MLTTVDGLVLVGELTCVFLSWANHMDLRTPHPETSALSDPTEKIGVNLRRTRGLWKPIQHGGHTVLD